MNKAATDVVMQTDIKEYPLFNRGKVRDIYDLGDSLLFVASDRISAFDVVMPNGIPGKGKVLTAMSLFWFDFLKDIVDNHLITADLNEYPEPLKKYSDQLEGRSMIVTKADRVNAECIVRGYISGSMWKELKKARENGSNTVHGFEFPPDLQESGKLPEPIFTPSTKADDGHDENISYEELEKIIGPETARLCREKSLAVYTKAAEYALTKGIIIADTKFEFGFKGGSFILIDEVLSPDSSRFWPVDKYEVGKSQPSFDKQPVRDYLAESGWNKKPPAPELPEEAVQASAERYREAQRVLTGK
ncbi:phosphoribosylaminoimidazolesuccinocarboxamide synthase [candidate division GN15 bacterium]|nr:phosphoribosylaminoimidazolesuccinocarboxamide synthase [candidate division GN15 bacterium]